jgi:hypothetical protein
MPLRLVDDDREVSVSLPLDPVSREALGIQIERASRAPSNSFEVRLVRRLIELVDSDLQPPTQKQLAYALNIAKVMGIAVPAEAVRFRGSMTEFLQRFSDAYQETFSSASMPPPNDAD